MERTIENYGLTSTFELIDRINCAVTWDDEEIEPCMRELCDRYNIDLDAFFNHEGMFDRTYEDLWDWVTREVYDDAVVHNEYSINNHDYVIVSLDSDEYSQYAVINRLNNNVMFNVYSIGTMRECKQYIKECVDNDD